jgi:DNA modification methylase
MIRKRSALFWEERNSWFSDLWDFKGIRQPLSQKGCRSRSAAFPFELAFRLINMYSIQNDTVLDPFLGTGTVTAAAIASARNSVGIEIDTGLCGLIKETITAATEAGNKRQSKRLSDHLHFVEGKELKHCNSFYSFPVVTTQETALRLPRSVTTEQTPSSSPSRLRYCSDHDFYEASGL